MPNYVIGRGDCFSSIAESCGFTMERLWNLPENAALKRKRKDPNILYPGDVIFVPEKEIREEACVTDKRHIFRRKGRVELRLRLLSTGEPIANEHYWLEIGGQALEGITDSEGRIYQIIPHDATDAELLIDQRRLKLRLVVGGLDPTTEIAGVQARLNNLGFRCGAVDGIMNPKTRSAIKAFQETYNLVVDGDPGVKTQGKLKEKHGC
jgi:hypothetical protein